MELRDDVIAGLSLDEGKDGLILALSFCYHTVHLPMSWLRAIGKILYLPYDRRGVSVGYGTFPGPRLT